MAAKVFTAGCLMMVVAKDIEAARRLLVACPPSRLRDAAILQLAALERTTTPEEPKDVSKKAA